MMARERKPEERPAGCWQKATVRTLSALRDSILNGEEVVVEGTDRVLLDEESARRGWRVFCLRFWPANLWSLSQTAAPSSAVRRKKIFWTLAGSALKRKRSQRTGWGLSLEVMPEMLPQPTGPVTGDHEETSKSGLRASASVTVTPSGEASHSVASETSVMGASWSLAAVRAS